MQYGISEWTTTLHLLGFILIPGCVCVCVCVLPQLQRCKVDLDSSLPRPLDSVVVWLQRAEAALTEEGGGVKDHADAAKEAREQQDTHKVILLLKLQDRF